MKKFLATLAFSLFGMVLTAQVIEQTYHFDQPFKTRIEGYEQIQFEGCMQSALAGQPTLPWHSISLLLPEGQEAESIEVVLSDFKEIDGIHQLYPYQPSRPYSLPERKAFLQDEETYASRSIYPSCQHGALTTHFMNGFGFAFCAITPVQYIPAEGKVSYAQTAIVRIKTKAIERSDRRKLWNTPLVRNKVTRLAQNPEAINTYHGKGRSCNDYDILVITPSIWVSSFNDYKEFYANRGLRVEVTSTEEIYSSMTGIDNQEKIRNYIIQEYEDHGIIMVNLGGDVQFVPYRGFYCSVQSSSVHTDNNIPADLYYCALDGNWNTNGNSMWGEIGEDDLLPEIGIGRMCFSNQEQFNNISNKSFNYQSSPVLGEFRTVTMGGENLYDNPLTNGSQYLELLIGDRNDNGYHTIGIPEDYNFIRLYHEDGNWSGNNLMAAINNGTQYVHHDGHANTNYVAGWYNSSITNQNFSGANGVDHNYTFFHTSGCICGDFTDDCILERMTQIANFAVGTIGNSRYGWFNEGQTEGPAIHLHRETEDAYYHERIPYVGMALSEAKVQTAPWVNAPGQWEEGALRWNFYDLNVMGDVAVSPWHDEPFTPEIQGASEILVGSTSYTLNVTKNGNALRNFRCTIVDSNNDKIGYALTNDDGIAEITFEQPLETVGEITLIVTGCDAWPLSQTLNVIPGNSAYVVYDSHEINDPNGNGQADFGEEITLNITLKNSGTIASSNINTSITTNNGYVTIIDGEASANSIPASGNTTINDAFTIKIADNAPDQELARFNMTCSDGSNSWNSNFSIRLNAPHVAMTSIEMEEESGNGNGSADPGETMTMNCVVKNTGHSTSTETFFEIYNSLPAISFEHTQIDLGTMQPEEEKNFTLTFSINSDSPSGVAYELPYVLTFGEYVVESSYSFNVGYVIEDFETGDFTKFDWQNTGSSVWTIVTTEPHQGTYCAKSGAIPNSSSTTLSITLDFNTDYEISFFKKVSSESGYDKFIFSIDGEAKSEWSGEVSWSQETYMVSSGTHTLSWSYNKDSSMSNGSDCAWLDDIVFPPTSVITKIETNNQHNIALHPNPAKETIQMSLPEGSHSIVIYNSLGQETKTLENVTDGNTIDIRDLKPGIYFVKTRSNDKAKTIKLIKQ